MAAWLSAGASNATLIKNRVHALFALGTAAKDRTTHSQRRTALETIQIRRTEGRLYW